MIQGFVVDLSTVDDKVLRMAQRSRAVDGGGGQINSPECCKEAARPCVRCEQRFIALWHTYRKELQRHAQRAIGGMFADDVVAEAFTIVWRRFRDVPTSDRPQRAWLHRTVALVAANARRRQARELDAVGVISPAGQVTESPSERIEVVQAYLALTPSDRQVLWLAGVEGMQGERLARQLGCSVGAAAVRCPEPALACTLNSTCKKPRCFDI